MLTILEEDCKEAKATVELVKKDTGIFLRLQERRGFDTDVNEAAERHVGNLTMNTQNPFGHNEIGETAAEVSDFR